MKIVDFFEKLAQTAFDPSKVQTLMNAQPNLVKEALNLNDANALKSLMRPIDIQCEANHSFVVHLV